MLAIIQARMSSRRLPGKVLRQLAGRPLLGWVVARVSAAQTLKQVVIATSVDVSDDPIAAFCEQEGLACHRGPLEDVAGRFQQAAAAQKAEDFVRISGDSPLMDPALIDQAVSLYRAGDWDLVSNVVARSFPIGQSVEILRTDTFNQVCQDAHATADREHVTPYYYANPKSFRILGFASDTDASAVRLSVDTPEDFQAAAHILAHTGGKPGGWRELVALKKALM